MSSYIIFQCSLAREVEAANCMLPFLYFPVIRTVRPLAKYKNGNFFSISEDATRTKALEAALQMHSAVQYRTKELAR